MLVYFKLFDLLDRRGMTLSSLRLILSSATVSKLRKSEPINCRTIERICDFLDCQPGDFMEYIPDSEPAENDLFPTDPDREI